MRVGFGGFEMKLSDAGTVTTLVARLHAIDSTLEWLLKQERGDEIGDHRYPSRRFVGGPFEGSECLLPTAETAHQIRLLLIPDYQKQRAAIIADLAKFGID
jgi:hypothetical protein